MPEHNLPPHGQLTAAHSFPYRCILVIGTTGSGKSTLAEQLAGKLGLDFIELDALNWGPNWIPAAEELLRARVESATRSPGWVVAGNYSAARPVTWPRAEAVIWLDYPFRVIFGRLFSRTLRRLWTRERLWGGNQERLGVLSNSGPTIPSFTGSLKPTGGGSANSHNCLPCRHTPIYTSCSSNPPGKPRPGWQVCNLRSKLARPMQGGFTIMGSA